MVKNSYGEFNKMINDTEKLEKLMDSDKCHYIRVEDQGRFAVTSGILSANGLKNKQVVTMDKFRAIIQIHERELEALTIQIKLL